MIYINADTLEYPRYDGDVALDPTANWQPVDEVPLPEVKDVLMLAIEVAPVLVNERWTQQFLIRPKTDDEIAAGKKLTKAQQLYAD
jgi:hypothetical protein